MRDPRAVDRLTPRQHEIAILVARGLTNREIGVAIGRSINTVKKHLKQLFVALDVANRTELAALVTHRFGLQ